MWRIAVVTICVVVTGTGCGSSNGPTAPTGNPQAGTQAGAASSATSAQPPFNLEAVLRGDGFGLVKFRQERNPAANIVDLDVLVRDLLPERSYRLQRAVDTQLDGVCTVRTG